MLFPSDEAKRQAFLEAAVADSFFSSLRADDCDDAPLPASLVRWALKVAPDFPDHFADGVRPSAHVPAKASGEGSMHGGYIAAYLILIPLVMHFRHQRSIGLIAARRVLTGWLRDKNQLAGASDRSLQHTWAEYQSVAHLWAAFILFGERLPATADELVDFLSLAELIRCWGAQYCPAHSRKPLLDEQITWTMPPGFPLRSGVGYDLGRVTMPDEWIALATAGNLD